MRAIHTCLLSIEFLALTLAPAYAANRYVALAGGHVSPFTSWTNAARDIQSAINVAANNDAVFVSNGVYAIGSTILLNKRISVQSVNGAALTTINGGGNKRCIEMTNGATIDGFTITGGWAVYGAGILSTSGMVVNCIIQNNTAYNPGPINQAVGGGTSLENSTMRNCIVASNTSEIAGGGIDCYNNVLVENTSILNNGAPAGAGLYVEGSTTIRNCLIARNVADMQGGGIFNLSTGDQCIHCSITENTAGTEGGGIYALGNISVVNSITYGNDAPLNSNYYGSTMSYSCTAPPKAGSMNISSSPMFANPGARDYRLLGASPCIDAGTNIIGIVSDRDGLPRVLDGNLDGVTAPDMGCYEFWNVSGNSTQDGNMLIQWPGVTNRKYSILTTTNLLLPFSPMATGITGRTPFNTYTNPTLDGVGFFSVMLE